MRWADLDPLGHVNNVVFVDYLQEARVDMLRVHAPGARSDDLAEGVVVVSHSVTYLRPLHFGLAPHEQQVLVDCWVSPVRAATFTLSCELYTLGPDGDRRVHARATTVLTPYIFATGSPRRLTADEIARLEQFAEPGFDEHPARVRVPVARDLPGAAASPVNVRFSDVDAYRHVNNVKYFEFFQESRLRFLAGLDPEAVDGLESAGDWPSMVLAHVDVSYRAPILHRAEPYQCWSALTRIGRTSFQMAAEIRDGDTLLAGGNMVLVFFDAVTESKTEPADRVRTILEESLAGRR